MSLLLKGGTVLIHGDEDRVTPTRADILVQGDRIAQVAAGITPPAGCEVIDCADKIISPGFVDTHHHVWQSPLRGLFGDKQLLPYMAIMFAASRFLDAEDIYWGNLAGSLQCIDAGTTTTLDHAHLNWSPQHSPQAIAGTITSGIRSVFAYTPTLALTEVQPKAQFVSNPMEPWVMETFEQLAKTRALGGAESRVKLGLGFDFYFLPQLVVKGIFDKVRSLGATIITSHFLNFTSKMDSLPTTLKRYGVLDERIVLSHGGCATARDIELMKEANAFIAVTPSTEHAMAVGPVVAFRKDLDADRVCALGVDCSSFTSCSIPNEMRAGLQTARAADSAEHRAREVFPRNPYHRVAEAYNLGTIQGARALCMEDDIGSIRVGKKADLVLFDALTPGMLAAAQQDPVMAIVMHSGIGDVDTVIVDGRVRKRGGKLLDVTTTEWRSGEFADGGGELAWSDVAAKVLQVQKKFGEGLQQCNLPEIEGIVSSMLHMPLSEA